MLWTLDPKIRDKTLEEYIWENLYDFRLYKDFINSLKPLNIDKLHFIKIKNVFSLIGTQKVERQITDRKKILQNTYSIKTLYPEYTYIELIQLKRQLKKRKRKKFKRHLNKANIQIANKPIKRNSI